MKLYHHTPLSHFIGIACEKRLRRGRDPAHFTPDPGRRSGYAVPEDDDGVTWLTTNSEPGDCGHIGFPIKSDADLLMTPEQCRERGFDPSSGAMWTDRREVTLELPVPHPRPKVFRHYPPYARRYVDPAVHRAMTPWFTKPQTWWMCFAQIPLGAISEIVIRPLNFRGTPGEAIRLLEERQIVELVPRAAAA